MEKLAYVLTPVSHLFVGHDNKEIKHFSCVDSCISYVFSTSCENNSAYFYNFKFIFTITTDGFLYGMVRGWLISTNYTNTFPASLASKSIGM